MTRWLLWPLQIILAAILIPVLCGFTFALERMRRGIFRRLDLHNRETLAHPFSMLIPQMTAGKIVEIGTWMIENQTPPAMIGLPFADLLEDVANLDCERQKWNHLAMTSARFVPRWCRVLPFPPLDVAIALRDEDDFLLFKLRWWE